MMLNIRINDAGKVRSYTYMYKTLSFIHCRIVVYIVNFLTAFIEAQYHINYYNMAVIQVTPCTQ